MKKDKKKDLRSLLILSLLSFAIFLAGCRQIVNTEVLAEIDEDTDITNPEQIIEAASLTLAGPLTLMVGESVTFLAEILPAEATQELSWSSNSPDIATVDGTGTVSGLTIGPVTISAATTDASNLTESHTVLVIDEHTSLDVNSNLALRAADFSIPYGDAPNLSLADFENMAYAGVMAWELDNLNEVVEWSADLTDLHGTTAPGEVVVTIVATNPISGATMSKDILVTLLPAEVSALDSLVTVVTATTDTLIGDIHTLQVELYDTYGNIIPEMATSIDVEFAATPGVNIGGAGVETPYVYSLSPGDSGTFTIEVSSDLANTYTTAVSLGGGAALATSPVSYTFLDVELVAGLSLVADSVVIPVGGSTTFTTEDSNGTVITDYTFSIAGTSTVTDATIDGTTGEVTAGSEIGTIVVQATKGNIVRQQSITVVDATVTGALWVETTESIELTATLEPVVAGLPVTYSWSVDAADAASLSATGTSATGTVTGESELRLNVPVVASITLGTDNAAAGTFAATLDRTHLVDVVDLVFTAPTPLPTYLVRGEAGTSFQVAIQPAGSDVPTGESVTWSQAAVAPDQEITITPNTNTFQAVIAGVADRPFVEGVEFYAVYGVGGAELDAAYTIDVEMAPMVFIYTIPSAGEANFVLPLHDSGSYNLRIDWGDGSEPELITQASQAIHSYPSTPTAQAYRVVVGRDIRFGTATGLWADGGDPVGTPMFSSSYYLTQVETFGDVQFINNAWAFAHLQKNVIFPGDITDTPYIEGDMAHFFRKSILFNQPVNHWDVSRVTYMQDTFNGASVFNRPLDTWDISNVTSLTGLFNGASSFNQDLNMWDTSNVVRMAYTFQAASAFNQPLYNWDTSGVTNMLRMFAAAESFNRNISVWDVSAVTTNTGFDTGANPEWPARWKPVF